MHEAELISSLTHKKSPIYANSNLAIMAICNLRLFRDIPWVNSKNQQQADIVKKMLNMADIVYFPINWIFECA
jgi:hypothetical protein